MKVGFKIFMGGCLLHYFGGGLGLRFWWGDGCQAILLVVGLAFLLVEGKGMVDDGCWWLRRVSL